MAGSDVFLDQPLIDSGEPPFDLSEALVGGSVQVSKINLHVTLSSCLGHLIIAKGAKQPGFGVVSALIDVPGEALHAFIDVSDQALQDTVFRGGEQCREVGSP